MEKHVVTVVDVRF